MAHYIIIGLGTFGAHLANELGDNGHDVVALDIDPKKVHLVQDHVSHAVIADVKDMETLDEFVGNHVDAVVVDLGATDASIFTVVHLRKLGVTNIIAKARDDLHGETLRLVGAKTVIYPEKETALQLAAKLNHPNLIEYLPLTGDFSIVEIPAPPNTVGKSLRDLELRPKYDVQVLAIKNATTDQIELIPDPSARIPLQSHLIILGRLSDIDRMKAAR